MLFNDGIPGVESNDLYQVAVAQGTSWEKYTQF